MTVQRIDRINERVQLQQVELEKTQYRLNLFNLNSYEHVSSVSLSDGSRIDIPTMNDSDRETAARLFAGVPQGRQAMLDQASQDLGKAIYAETQKALPVGKMASSSALSALTAAAQAYTTAVDGVNQSEASTVFMGTMYMGLVGLEGDLAGKAKDLQSKNKLADDLRTDMTEIRNELSNWGDPESKKTFTYTQVNPDGTTEIVSKTVNKAEAEALLKELDEKLTSVRDLSEMAKFDLQKNLEDYQQALQTFSGILKEAHDTMKNTINNLKA